MNPTSKSTDGLRGATAAESAFRAAHQFVPTDWLLMELGAVASFANGFNANKDAYGKGIPFANVLEVITHSHLRKSDIPGRVKLSSEERETFSVRRGDILFNRTSETQGEAGLSAVYDDDEEIVFGGFVIRGRFTVDRFDDKYVGYAFRAPMIRSQIIAQAQGAIRANIGQSSLKRILVPVPSKEEQRAIAEALSDVDSLLGALEALIVKKRAIKQGAMQQLLTGKTRLPGFGGEWETRHLRAFVTFLRNGVNSRAELTDNGPVRYLHYGDIHSSTDIFLNPHVASMPRLSPNRARTLDRLQSGDLIFVDASEDIEGVGKSVEVTDVDNLEVVAGLHTIAARLDTAIFANRFRAYLQFCPTFRAQLRRLAAGTKVYATSRSHIASVEMPLPEIEEQAAIAAVLADMDGEIASLERRREKVRSIKQGMMQQLLTGRIRLVDS